MEREVGSPKRFLCLKIYTLNPIFGKKKTPAVKRMSEESIQYYFLVLLPKIVTKVTLDFSSPWCYNNYEKKQGGMKHGNF